MSDPAAGGALPTGAPAVFAGTCTVGLPPAIDHRHRCLLDAFLACAAARRTVRELTKDDHADAWFKAIEEYLGRLVDEHVRSLQAT